MTRRWSSIVLCAVLGSSAAAAADVWQRAIDDPAARDDRFELELRRGDELALRANARSLNAATATTLVDQAIAAYRAAAAVQPASAEPYFRIASVLESFFIDCDNLNFVGPVPQPPPKTCPPNGSPIERTRGREAVRAWDAFEARAPRDPRLADALFSRAILRTKLVDNTPAARAHLEGALADYTALLDRGDGLTRVDVEQIWGNLAETYMMLGRMEEAIDAYKDALRLGGGASTAYGLAVALDRDENVADAFQVIRAQPIEEFAKFRRLFARNLVFYVPKGEEFYYFALIFEAHGYVREAIANWRLFLASGAHPQFQPRAKRHLDDLLVKQRTLPAPRTQRPPIDPFDLYP